MSGPQARTPVIVTHVGGLQFAAQVRGHVVHTDQPERGGGEDAAPTPMELISVALGSCVALYVHQFCATRGIRHADMWVEVVPLNATSPNRIGELAVTVHLPEPLSPHVMEMLERVVRSCPAHNTLVHGAAVSFAIDTLSPEVAAT